MSNMKREERREKREERREEREESREKRAEQRSLFDIARSQQFLGGAALVWWVAGVSGMKRGEREGDEAIRRRKAEDEGT